MAVLGPWPHGNPVPLTPQERDRLAEIEAGLRADPHFSLDQAVGERPEPGDHRRPDHRGPDEHHVRRTMAVAMMLIGIALSVAGTAMAPHSFVVGFVVILTGFITVVAGTVFWFAAGDLRNP